MAISSITLLNGDGVNAAAAIARPGVVQDSSAAAQKDTTPSSSISIISASGKARLSLEGLQARATALKAANVPPTVSDFKVAVQGIVGSINALRTTLSSALSELRSGSQSIARAKAFIDRIAAGNKDEGAAALAKRIGIENQGDGIFSINQKQLTNAFNEDSKAAFSTLTAFTGKVAEAKNVPAPDKKDNNEMAKDVTRRADELARTREADVTQQVGTQNQADSAKQDAQLASVSGFTAKLRSRVT